ncbi:MAG: hypothetical protein OZSIB_1655 [Candidatus Ozemobacter sibiricus]|jgi:hypothetical protein|uniref:Uncharacterized protein n=1 Tax=Candidatus Ozemobacter sibiricus TaxID=2268124 RepID=A0A367ZJQ4_9BACT|nr:MAG: hypothetical protein OZSIB_1655 [Candidatus Ozemobacter sibiricus]
MVVGLIVALLGLGGLVGCGCGKRGEGTPAASSSDPIYVATAKEKAVLALERKGKRSELPLPPPQNLYQGDVVENTGPKAALLTDFKRGHRFTLAPATRVMLEDGRLTVYKGGTRLVFKRSGGEFKVVLPGNATLGVRGTELIVVVTDDGRTVVRMLDGRVDLERDGTITPLSTPQTALLGPASAPLQIVADPASLTADLLADPAAAAIGLGSDTELVERDRDSAY